MLYLAGFLAISSQVDAMEKATKKSKKNTQDLRITNSKANSKVSGEGNDFLFFLTNSGPETYNSFLSVPTSNEGKLQENGQRRVGNTYVNEEKSVLQPAKNNTNFDISNEQIGSKQPKGKNNPKENNIPLITKEAMSMARNNTNKPFMTRFPRLDSEDKK